VIGTLNTIDRSATVIGAGIAGLLSAYYLDRRGYVVTLLEEQARAGGLVRTRHTDQGIAESAAHSLIATETVLELCRDLGVELVQPRKEARAKYIVRKGRLRRFPLSPLETAATLRRAAFVRANGEEQNLEGWARRHLGDAAHNYLMTPFVRGIYGVQPAELGVMAAYPSLKVPTGETLLSSLIRKRRKKGPQAKENKQRVAPRFGMGDLVAKLDEYLQRSLGDRFRKGERVTVLPATGNVIIATPAHAAAGLVETESPQLAMKLRSVRYTPIVSVTVFVERKAFTHPVEGVGALMPSCEDRNCLGILFNSSSFQDRVTDESKLASFTVMMGGTSQPEWLNASDSEIEQAIRNELALLLGVGSVQRLVIHRWPAALPQYGNDLPAVWQLARETWCATPGQILFGNYCGQISLRGMIESAAKLS
jgi:protoporphyrinogen/coproporphyrinogen III oxidase